MRLFQKKRLRFLAIWIVVFAAVFASWGALNNTPASGILFWLNAPSILVAMRVSGNVHQPSFIGLAVVYFTQWVVVGYMVAWVIYRKSSQAT